MGSACKTVPSCAYIFVLIPDDSYMEKPKHVAGLGK